MLDEFEDIKWLIRSVNGRRTYNTMAKGKGTNRKTNNLQNTTQKHKDQVTERR